MAPASRNTSTQRARNVRWEERKSTSNVDESAHLSDEDHEQVQESTDQSEDFQICLTMICSNGRLACSYFDPERGILYAMEDTEENSHFDLTIQILEQLSPDLVLASSRSDELFMDTVREKIDTLNGQFQVRPWKEFTPARGLARLQSLPLLAALVNETNESEDTTSESEPRNAYDFMQRRQNQDVHPSLKRWIADVRVGNFTLDSATAPFCISTVGALLDHLARAKAVEGDVCEADELDDITSLQALTLDHVMQINVDALVSLQVFLNEKHASVYSNVVKEGLSIYGILHQTRTPFGATLMRQWLLRPSTSLSIIQERHDAVACFMDPENVPVAESLHKNIGGLKGAPLALNRLKKGKATLQNWKATVQFWVHSALLRTNLAELRNTQGVPVVQELSEMIGNSTFLEVAELINTTIDWEESTNVDRITVKPMVDEELDEWKETLAGIDSLLSKVAETVANDIPAQEATRFEELRVIYFPQLGYLISVPLRADISEEEQRVGLEDWTFQFLTEESVYFKSQKMHDMDYHIGDLNTYITDREIEIVQQLQQAVLEHVDSITTICERAAILDCLLSFSAAARQYQWNRPTMCDEIIIDINEGRHPLQELVDDRFVANDAYARGGTVQSEATRRATDDMPTNETASVSSSDEGWDGNRIVICTGANASGKSIYLKQCILIPYLAQIGCFVPAASAKLGVIDKVFTRIQTRESVSKMQSAFMIDLNQISFALRNATTPRSVLILDEFGKGTLAADGAGLFAGVIRHLLNLGSSCPLVFAATHFHEVLNPSMLSPSLPISFVHMAVMITTESGVTMSNDSPAPDSEARQAEERRLIRPGEAVTYLFKWG